MTHIKHILSAILLFISCLYPISNCTAAGFILPTDDFQYIAPGTFTMGDNASKWYDERPAHTVTISKGFGIQKHEVTQVQWIDVMGTRPWRNADGSLKNYVIAGDNFPAVYVSFEDVQSFITQLNANAGSNIFRLPTEAEWEYACRAGTTTPYSFGDDDSLIDTHAWFRGNAWDMDEKWAHGVGLKNPNPWCLYDIHGNVWEWCSDWYDINYYASSPSKDPAGPVIGDGHVIRGGSFVKIEDECRSTRRQVRAPSVATYDLGFRLVRTDSRDIKYRPTMEDLLIVLRICAGTKDAICMLHGDINHDGHIDLTDAIGIIQAVSRLRD